MPSLAASAIGCATASAPPPRPTKFNAELPTPLVKSYAPETKLLAVYPGLATACKVVLVASSVPFVISNPLSNILAIDSLK